MEDMKKKNQKKQIIRVLSESVQKIIEQERMDFTGDTFEDRTACDCAVSK